MKQLICLLVIGVMLLGPRAMFAQPGSTFLATPPEPPRCANDESGWKLSILVPQSDIIAFGRVQAPEQGVFTFQIDEHVLGGEGFSTLNVMHYNAEHYGNSCAQEFSQVEPLFSPIAHRDRDYLMAFSVIEGNQVQVNGVIPLGTDQTVRVNVGQDDITEFKSLTREQLRQQIQGSTPEPSTTPVIIMVGLIVVAVGAGIAAFLAWRRQQTH